MLEPITEYNLLTPNQITIQQQNLMQICSVLEPSFFTLCSYQILQISKIAQMVKFIIKIRAEANLQTMAFCPKDQQIINQIEYLTGNIIPMLKKQTAACSPDSFSLAGLADDCYFRAVSASFEAPLNLSSGCLSVIPTFLRDGRHFTPAFILPRDYEYYEKNVDFQKFTFEDKIAKARSQSIRRKTSDGANCQINLEAPGTVYCQICKAVFDSYWLHIKQNSHAANLSLRSANKFIHELCLNYRTQQKVIKQMYKNRRICKKNRQDKKIQQYVHACQLQTSKRRITRKSMDKPYNNNVGSEITLQL